MLIHSSTAIFKSGKTFLGTLNPRCLWSLPYQKTNFFLIAIFLLFLCPQGFAEDFWSTDYPLQLSDGTSIPKPFSTQAQLDQRLSDMKKKYEPFTRNLVAASPYLRPETDISGSVWTFREDPEARGEMERWFAMSVPEKGWLQQALPDYREFALGWYRTTFDAPSWSAERIMLRFDAVDYGARVYLNERYIGEHIGYFAPFEFDVTDLLKPTGNVLAVRVDNPPSWDGQHNSFQGDGMGTMAFNKDRGIVQFSNAAGIYQPVKLVGRSRVYVAGIKVTPQWPDTAKVEAKLVNETGDSPDFRVSVSVHPRNFKGQPVEKLVSLRVSKENEELFSCRLNKPKYWTPDEPYLYTVRVTIRDGRGKILDSAEETFGMRWIEQAPDSTFLLNREPFFIRGTGSFATFWPASVRQDSDSIIKDILLHKAANQDMTRPHLHVLPKFFYQYADMYGLMIYLDMPLNSFEGFGGNLPNQPDMIPAYAEEIKRQFRDAVGLLYNHPSIVIWQFVNESQVSLPTPQIPPALKEMVRLSRQIDPTRLPCASSGFTAAGFPTNPNQEWWGINDIHWYSGVLLYTMPYMDYWPDKPATTREFTPDAKKIVTEYGIPAYPNWENWRDSFPWEIPSRPDELYDVRNIPKCEPVYRGIPFLGDVLIRAHLMKFSGEAVRPLEWIKHTQDYQSYLTKGSTDMFRRRPDVNGYSHFYLINAGPMTFGSGLIDNDRNANPAYFALAQANEPRRVNIQEEGRRFYGGSDLLGMRLWVYNDPIEPIDASLQTILADEKGNVLAQQKHDRTIDGATRIFIDDIKFKLPEVKSERSTFYIYAIMSDKKGLINYDCIPIEVFNKEPDPVAPAIALYDKIGKTALALKEAKADYKLWLPGQSMENISLLIIGAFSSDSALTAAKAEIASFINKGGSVLVFNQNYYGQTHSDAFSGNWHLERAVTIMGEAAKSFDVPAIPCDLSWLPINMSILSPGTLQQSPFVQRIGRSPLMQGLKHNDFFNWHGGLNIVVELPIDMRDENETLLTCGVWQMNSAVVLKSIGAGQLLFSQLLLVDRYGVDPIATRIFNRMLNPDDWGKTPDISLVKSASVSPDGKALTVELTITNPTNETFSGDLLDQVFQDHLQEKSCSQFKQTIKLKPGETKTFSFSRNLSKPFIGDLSPAVFVCEDDLWVTSNMPAIGMDWDSLEKVRTYDFGRADSAVAKDSIQVTPASVYSEGKEFGWNNNGGIMASVLLRDRNPLTLDFNFTTRIPTPKVFSVRLPVGKYYFRIMAGDASPCTVPSGLQDTVPPISISCNGREVGRLVRLVTRGIATLAFEHTLEQEGVVEIKLESIYDYQVVMVSALEIYRNKVQ